MLTQTKVPVAICLFIDGLDEFDGRYDNVVETINSLSTQTHVKVCLSSRPLANFEKAFVEMPSLRLQDLTCNSILAYADHQLSNLIKERISDSKLDKDRTRSLLRKIVGQAEGVFLWAVVAIRDVREGLQDMADLDELESMIEDLPPGIENLYMQIIRRIKPAYRREAMRFLQIVLYEPSNSVNLMRSLDLHMLYFIDLQRVSEDLPLVCNRVDLDTLVGACNALKTRLLSHTLGLLDLVPMKNVDHDQTNFNINPDQTYFESDSSLIFFTKVHVHHRTVKDFLLHNIEAKSFMAAAGLKREHLHLCIARGIFAYLIHLAQEDIWCCFDLSPNLPFYHTLRSALTQVAIVEKLVGTAQTKLMRSLNDHSLMPKSLLTAGDESCRVPYVIRGSYKASVDLIPLAANSGMLRYVCEVLDFPALESQRSSSTKLLDFRQFVATEKAVIAGLSWVTTTKHDLHPSDYRQRLHERLEWKTYVQENDRIEAKVGSNTLVETYLLAGCKPSLEDLYLADKLSFIQILLQAGANPMVRVEPAIVDHGLKPSECFWRYWLYFLHCFTTDSLKIYPSRLADKSVTLDDLFNTTKALLAQGANIDFSIASIHNSFRGHSLMRHDLADHRLSFKLESTAMFWLEKYFSGYPEFRDFAAAIEPQITRPRRKILSIFCEAEDSFIPYDKPDERSRAYLSDEESGMLWPLIEKWEESGESNDLETVCSAMRQVWKAHRPDIRLREEPDWEESVG